MSEPFIGLIMPCAMPFAPRDWAFCNGQVMNIVQFQALYAVIGFTYGGDGRTTFMLPNLNGRMPVGQSLDFIWGQVYGATTATLNAVIAHTHSVDLTTSAVRAQMCAVATNGTADTPADGLYPAIPTTNGSPTSSYVASPASPMVPLGDAAIDATTQTGVGGGSQPFSIVPPLQGINYIICISGLFPPRS